MQDIICFADTFLSLPTLETILELRGETGGPSEPAVRRCGDVLCVL